MIINPDSQFGQDLDALITYCMDDKEYHDFLEWLLNDGSEYLTDKELEVLRSNWADSEPILNKVAMNPEVRHVYAAARRIVEAIGWA